MPRDVRLHGCIGCCVGGTCGGGGTGDDIDGGSTGNEDGAEEHGEIGTPTTTTTNGLNAEKAMVPVPLPVAPSYLAAQQSLLERIGLINSELKQMDR